MIKSVEGNTMNESRSKTKGLLIYMEPDLHHKFKKICTDYGVSMNKIVNDAIKLIIEDYDKQSEEREIRENGW